MSKLANGSATGSESSFSRNSRPLLLSSNRKLRHLRGISIRNLLLSNTCARLPGKIFDDDAIPYSLKTSTRLLTVEEESNLSHSRSFSDLRSERAAEPAIEHHEPTSPLPRRTSQGKSARPKPTLQRTNTSPRQRKEDLKDVIQRRIGNVFFSLHCSGVKDPVYVSEVMRDTMNPDFRFIDMGACDAAVSRHEYTTLRVWVQSRASSQWTLLIDLSLSLRHLHYVGRSTDDLHQSLGDNAIVFHLSDGIYMLPSDPAIEQHDSPLPSFDQQLAPRAEPTSSYDALMRLSTLDQCIRDSVASREKITGDIQRLIHENKLRSQLDAELASSQDSLSSTTRAMNTEKKAVKSVTTRISDLRKTLQARRDAIASGRQAQIRTSADLVENKDKLRHCQTTYNTTLEALTGQRRRICEDLLDIYPIEPIPGRSLAFTLRDLPLPNSTFNDSKEETIAAALGHAAHMLYLLSFYLSAPLPYPIHPSSSLSTITDPISLSLPAGPSARTFPLYIKGTVFYRFEYAVFLLNKDIEFVAEKLGLKVLDIRQTLPNLKYVLFVATAGRGQAPGRKAGGVRGLTWRGKVEGMNGSGSGDENGRQGSEDTINSVGRLRRIAALRTSS